MLLKAVQFVAAFLLYGYFQKVSSSGFLVGLCLGSYFVIQGNWKHRLVVLVYGGSLFAGSEVVQFFSYLSICACLLISSPVEDADTLVTFRPFEEEIRKYLFRVNPSVLHKVDRWLDKYKGNEAEVLKKLKAKYDVQPVKTAQPLNHIPSPVLPQARAPPMRGSYSFNEDDVLTNPYVYSSGLQSRFAQSNHYSSAAGGSTVGASAEFDHYDDTSLHMSSTLGRSSFGSPTLFSSSQQQGNRSHLSGQRSMR